MGRGQIQALASLFYADGPNDVAPLGYNEPEARAGLPASPLAPPAHVVGFGFEAPNGGASDRTPVGGVYDRLVAAGRSQGGVVGKFVLIIIVWVVAICLFTGILLTGAVAWFKHGGHPIILAVILGVDRARRLGHHRRSQGERRRLTGVATGARRRRPTPPTDTPPAPGPSSKGGTMKIPEVLEGRRVAAAWRSWPCLRRSPSPE